VQSRTAAPGWAVLAVCCAAQFMVVLDVSIVNVALPSMRADLHLSAVGQQCVINAYTLTFGGFLLLGGRAADIFGRRRVFLSGLGLFTACSLLGGAAQNGGELIAARAVQGVGGAILAPATLSLLHDHPCRSCRPRDGVAVRPAHHGGNHWRPAG
jgi:MFS family permease